MNKLTRNWAIGLEAAALVLMLGVSVHPAVAQVVDPQGCSDSKDMVAYLVGPGADEEAMGLASGVGSLLANAKLLRNATCGTPGDDSPPSAMSSNPPLVQGPVSSDDITACLPMNNLQALLGRPTQFHAGDDPQHANFMGPTGATLQIERAPSDGATIYQQHLDEGLSHTDWQIAGVDGLGDKAFAANRGGDSRSLVIQEGDTAWLLHMDGVPAGTGFPQLGAIARNMLSTCP
jgi:hypothetical protein